MHMLLLKYRIPWTVFPKEIIFTDFRIAIQLNRVLTCQSCQLNTRRKKFLNPSSLFPRVSELYTMLWAGNFLHLGFKALNLLFKAFISKCVGGWKAKIVPVWLGLVWYFSTLNECRRQGVCHWIRPYIRDWNFLLSLKPGDSPHQQDCCSFSFLSCSNCIRRWKEPHKNLAVTGLSGKNVVQFMPLDRMKSLQWGLQAPGPFSLNVQIKEVHVSTSSFPKYFKVQ